MSADFGLYEFAVGSTVGIREFRIDSLGRLTGITHQVVWRPGENVAVCRRESITPECMKEHGHHSYWLGSSSRYSTSLPSSARMMTSQGPSCATPNPCKGLDPSCACGFYAFYGKESTYHDQAATVTGIVECYGKTVVGTKGFRAEKGRIVALCIPSTGPVEAIKNTRISAVAKGFGRYYAGPLATVPAVATQSGAVGWISLGLLGLTTCLSTSTYLIRRSNRRLAAVHPDVPESRSELLARVRENYPEVPTYGSIKAMLDAHPTDSRAAGLTPESDPEFWDRAVAS